MLVNADARNSNPKTRAASLVDRKEAEAPPATAEKKPRPAASRSIQSIKTIEQRVQDAIEQAEEAGFRVGKKTEATAKPAKREKGALAKS